MDEAEEWEDEDAVRRRGAEAAGISLPGAVVVAVVVVLRFGEVERTEEVTAGEEGVEVKRKMLRKAKRDR